uniref:Folate receptor n=1 Tax=Rhipicephalus appendiculatus TaxID=34631 RepID=A0A131YLY9_RHIAP
MEVRIISSVLVIALLDRYLSASADVSTCLDARNHKSEPGPESNLYGHCTPWKDHACCTDQTTHDVHHKDMYSMSLDFCEEQTNVKMSSTCREHFRKDLCFYECEPNIGPWIVTVERKIGKERFFEVPLCYSDCVAWWEDCKYDYACTPNWPRGFKFYGGKNHCPKGAKCVTFEEMYKGPTDFCSQVWDHSWKVVPDHVPCMHMWFNTTSGGNPNRAVAEFYYQRGKRGQGSAELPNAADHVASSMAAQLVLLLATSTAAMLAWIDVFHHC